MKNILNVLIKLYPILNNQIDKLNNYIVQLTKDNKIFISEFATIFNLEENITKEILDTLCDLNILHKVSDVYVCSKCKSLLGVLTKWDEGDNIVCHNCNTLHPNASIYDTKTIYVLQDEEKLKLYTVEWLDKFEKDSNGNNLPRRVEVIAYNKSDAESLVHEYFHYVQDSIKVSTGLELQNKMLLKEYN